jgi:hypothetical protein
LWFSSTIATKKNHQVQTLVVFDPEQSPVAWLGWSGTPPTVWRPLLGDKFKGAVWSQSLFHVLQVAN